LLGSECSGLERSFEVLVVDMKFEV
jgi:hypothetical protein